MEAAALDEIKQQLESQLDQLLSSAGQSVQILMEMDGREADLLDRATVESGRDYTFRLRTRENLLIRKILKALEAIETGEFGICQKCGNEISPARLRARPVTEYCITCKSEMEKWEKAAGM